jgi:hypothetical protein
VHELLPTVAEQLLLGHADEIDVGAIHVLIARPTVDPEQHRARIGEHVEATVGLLELACEPLALGDVECVGDHALAFLRQEPGDDQHGDTVTVPAQELLLEGRWRATPA